LAFAEKSGSDRPYAASMASFGRQESRYPSAGHFVLDRPFIHRLPESIRGLSDTNAESRFVKTAGAEPACVDTARAFFYTDLRPSSFQDPFNRLTLKDFSR